ncbi:hypothetical protein WJT74_05080 [Sphingomicrobium sp. XHP0239]|uniref:hypothetical protein n=1 Tax=Sphingomicrobium maritimum TaxID=3133972 RepID=UPI0031CCC27F
MKIETEDGLLRSYSISELIADHERREALPPTDPNSPTGFERDNEAGGWDLHWGNYAYFVPDDRLKTPEELLWWIHHLGSKGWKRMTPGRIARFIMTVALRRGWEPYGDNAQG